MTHCIFVVLLIGSATGTFDYKGRATLADLMEFFRTTERIAVLVRSYSRLIDGEDVIKCSSEMTPGHLTKEFISTGIPTITTARRIWQVWALVTQFICDCQKSQVWTFLLPCGRQEKKVASMTTMEECIILTTMTRRASAP
ncbi:uncharacterized protein LOC142585064 isoform X4 [Dermacentor variabilis]|uniref:uncharacterized protein LOC142585064 isoform X4 n=1 Tax=Dermacentor variabilis TaxID=34621 RepID=UPI003F5B743F